jgi:hypothetical protein
MRTLASLATILTLASGCLLVFDGRDRDDCLLGAQEPAIAVAPLRNPDTLTCEAFGGGCNPDCGPCPATDLPAERQPVPSWGFCGSTCEALSEGACAEAPGCRVVKDAFCAVAGDCLTDYVGCFPTDQFTDPSIDCFAARDGQACSMSAGCTAFHRSFVNRPEEARTFAMCAPEGHSPGTCFGQVTCRAAEPACSPNSRPGVSNGCYTGACIPTDICEPVPQQ